MEITDRGLDPAVRGGRFKIDWIVWKSGVHYTPTSPLTHALK